MSIEAVRAQVEAARRFVLPLRDGPTLNQPDEPHPLTRFVELDGQPAPPKMVIPGFVQAGVVIISGQQGVGKTTVLVPLAMVAAGLHAPGDPLAPRHWRHVVYVSEDVSQVQRIVSGVVGHAGIALDMATVRERFHVVPALRMPAEQVAAVGEIYSERFTRTVDGVELPPLVVIDTRSATIDTDNEDDNAEAGRIVALFKQRFTGLPLWLVGHLAKILTGRRDVQALSTRGAGAIKADANQTIFLVAEDDGRRFLVLGKRRFEPEWTELEVRPGTADTIAVDEFGKPVPLTLRWGLPVPPTMSRAEAREDAQHREADQARQTLRAAVLETVEAAWARGMPINREGVKLDCRGRREDIVAAIAVLISEGWLVEVEVPRELRTHHKRRDFLVRLADNERRDYLAGKGLAPEKAAIPQSWRKQIPSVPDSGTDAPAGGHE
jgi:hypothetical protein